MAWWGNDESLSTVFADGQCILCMLKFSDKAWGLLHAVKYQDPDEVKKLLGKHIIEQHQDCDNIKWKYANYVHQSGKLLHRWPNSNSQLANQKPFLRSAEIIIAQNAYCSRDIYLQFTKYLRSVILPSIIQMNAGRWVSLVKINALFSRTEYDLAH